MENSNMSNKSLFGKILDFLEDKFLWVSMVVLFFMTLFITADAGLRYVIGSPIPGGFEISEEYLLPAIGFLAFSAVFTMGGHIRVTMLVERISKKVMMPINIIQDILMLAYSLLITYGGYKVTVLAIERSEYSNSILAYPMAPAYALAILGFGLLAMREIYYLLKPSERQANLEIKHE